MRLLMLNGWAASEVFLKQFKAVLPSDYELIVLDELYALELDDVVSKINEVMTVDTVIVGWSLGGMLGLYYVSRLNGHRKSATHPMALVLLNSFPCFLEKSDYVEGVKIDAFNGLREVVGKQDSSSLVRLFTNLLVSGSGKHKEDRRFLKPVFTSDSLPSWSVLLKGLDYLENLDLRADLEKIQLPVFAIYGEYDALIKSSTLDALSKNIRTFRSHVIPSMGHFPFGFYAKTLTKEIVTYIESLSDEIDN